MIGAVQWVRADRPAVEPFDAYRSGLRATTVLRMSVDHPVVMGECPYCESYGSYVLDADGAADCPICNMTIKAGQLRP